ncbi:putative bifunctional diguanylate cyclase/phosphodiesterase [Aurantiacibacter rhizosphaerae]|nr:EAL domain-containing protein [Aurantiacibacter rhizosphaerae]
MLDLIRHDIPERDTQWWAQCKLNHTKAFPYLQYDIVRTVLGVAVLSQFLPLLYLIAVAVMGGAITMRQAFIERRIAAKTHSSTQNYRALQTLVLVRAITWSVPIGLALTYAPEELVLLLVSAGIVITFIDALCMIAMPKRALIAATIQAAAMALALISRGGWPHILAAIPIVAGLFFLHWALFNLHYMFATRRLRTRTLRQANDTIQLLLNHYDEDGSDWLFECDNDGRILRPNHRFCAAARCLPEELEGMKLSQLFSDSTQRDELREISKRKAAFRNHVLPLEIEGEQLWWSISARPIYHSDGEMECWRGFIADVTRTRQAEEKVTYMAHYDVLTNLPNRNLFATTLKRSFARREGEEISAVLYIDLDHFKAVNDNYGHETGDRVLAEASRRIESAVDPRAIVARLGGDEFAVLLDQIADRGAALKTAEAIVTAMDKPIVIDGQEMPIGASVGIAFAPDNGTDGEDVLRAADLALYDAKARGRRGASVFDPAMQTEVQERRAMELDLRVALSRRELELHYQPLLDLQSGEVAGYEALLRWYHPTRGQVSPTDFIAIAEATGQIVEIGAWVIRQALQECANWPEHLSVSVNLSPAQMRSGELTGTIVNALAASGVAPHRLELEITENLLMMDSKENIALLHKLRELGVQIALDDFGTGYSSLNYLRSFPFDKIKIDRCFVNDIANRDDSDAIVDAVVGLAGKLNMRTTAEGVENAEQLERLRQTGCTQVQGFLFSRAVPASELGHPRADMDGGPPTPIACVGESALTQAQPEMKQPDRKRSGKAA